MKPVSNGKGGVKINKKIPIRQCISCRNQLLREGFIRLTKLSNLSSGAEKVILNPSRFQLGRSVYLCKSSACINLAMKEKKIQKMLRISLKSLETIVPRLEEFSKLNSQCSTPSFQKAVIAK